MTDPLEELRAAASEEVREASLDDLEEAARKEALKQALDDLDYDD